MAGATRMIFFFMSMLASVSQARMMDVRRLSAMPLTICVGTVVSNGDIWLMGGRVHTFASVFALSAVGRLVSSDSAQEVVGDGWLRRTRYYHHIGP